MRNVKYIVVHCTATSQKAKVSAIQRYWRETLGWKSPGYHFIVLPDGSVQQLADISQVTNGVKGFNSVSVNISYIGGVDANNAPIDNRTPEQKETILRLLRDLKQRFTTAVVKGHRDFPNVRKACPSFDAIKEYASI